MFIYAVSQYMHRKTKKVKPLLKKMINIRAENKRMSFERLGINREIFCSHSGDTEIQVVCDATSWQLLINY